MGAFLSQTSDRKTRRSTSLSVEVQDWLNSASFIPADEFRQLSLLCENQINKAGKTTTNADVTQNCAPNIFKRKCKSSNANLTQSVFNGGAVANNDLPNKVVSTEDKPLRELFLKHNDSDTSLALEKVTDEDIITYLACRAILDGTI